MMILIKLKIKGPNCQDSISATYSVWPTPWKPHTGPLDLI